MKTIEKITATMVDAARESRFEHPDISPLPARDEPSLIQWATEQQIQDVSKKLARIKLVVDNQGNTTG